MNIMPSDERKNDIKQITDHLSSFLYTQLLLQLLRYGTTDEIAALEKVRVSSNFYLGDIKDVFNFY